MEILTSFGPTNIILGIVGMIIFLMSNFLGRQADSTSSPSQHIAKAGGYFLALVFIACFTVPFAFTMSGPIESFLKSLLGEPS